MTFLRSWATPPHPPGGVCPEFDFRTFRVELCSPQGLAAHTRTKLIRWMWPLCVTLVRTRTPATKRESCDSAAAASVYTLNIRKNDRFRLSRLSKIAHKQRLGVGPMQRSDHVATTSSPIARGHVKPSWKAGGSLQAKPRSR